jgi:hypothetical protein
MTMSMGGDGIGLKNLQQALTRWTTASIDVGLATGGTNTTVDDTRKDWPVNIWAGGRIKIIKANGQEYERAITSNTATQITFAALPGVITVDAGDVYSVRDAASVVGPATEATLVKIVPIAKAAIFNTALPAAENAWLGADIAPTNSPSFLRIHVTVAVAGVIRVARTVGGVTVVEDLNAGNPLTQNAAYIFDVEWRTGDTVNFRYSVTAANILVFRADEFGAAV